MITNEHSTNRINSITLKCPTILAKASISTQRKWIGAGVNRRRHT